MGYGRFLVSVHLLAALRAVDVSLVRPEDVTTTALLLLPEGTAVHEARVSPIDPDCYEVVVSHPELRGEDAENPCAYRPTYTWIDGKPRFETWGALERR